MKPSPFEISCPGSLDAAHKALHENPRGTRIISGGQSLGPMLNLRLARPSRLVDVTGLSGLAEIRQTDSHVEIGAAVTHARIEDGEVPDPIPGMLRHVAAGIAYRAVRNRGTIGGSLCHADPAADWVTAMTALGATLLVRDGSGGAPLVSTELAQQIATTGAVPPLDTVKTVLRDSGLTLSDVKIHQLAIAHSRAVTEALSDA